VFPQPEAETGDATDITETTAKLHGRIDTKDTPTYYGFAFGTTEEYGDAVAEWTKPVSGGVVDVSADLTGLQPNTTYHYVFVAFNGSFIPDFGDDRTFTTEPAVRAVTGPAVEVGTTSATLKGTVNPGGVKASYEFVYGTTLGYGSSAPIPEQDIGSGSEDISVSESLTGLKAHTTYYYRINVHYGEHVKAGEERTFFTGSWSSQSTPNPTLPPNPVNLATLEAVSCPSSTFCLAAGVDSNSGKGFGERWDGSAWKTEAGLSERPVKPLGIACTSTTSCQVVGSKGSGSSAEAAAERWYYYAPLKVWTSEESTLPQPAGGSYVKLDDVSCTSESACTAVGSYYKEGTLRTLAERWNGSSWSIQTTVNPESGVATTLTGVSCDSATSCTAVGQKGSSSEVFAERWNGSSWSVSSTPKPSSSVGSALQDVSCTSSSNCMAVGYYYEESSNKKTLAERWNGSSWSIVSSPNPATNYGASLLSVSCTSSSACTAVGRYVSSATYGLESLFKEEKTLAESWGGSEWAIQSSPNPEGRKLSRLNGVSCSASNACTAVGWAKKGKDSSEADTVTLGARYE
jgi:hypothetical protein